MRIPSNRRHRADVKTIVVKKENIPINDYLIRNPLEFSLAANVVGHSDEIPVPEKLNRMEVRQRGCISVRKLVESDR